LRSNRSSCFCTYQQDGKISEVMEEDASGQWTVATNYGYDAPAGPTAIVQGVQTRPLSMTVWAG